MNILYLHQYFNTPEQPGSTRSYWLAKELQKDGHNITIITSTKTYLQKKTIEIEGIKVVYLRVKYDQKMSFLRRLFSFFMFVYKCSVEALINKRYDLVIATSTPLTIGIPALILKYIKHTPFIFEVRDLWPEVPIQMGIIKNKILINFTKRFEKLIYQNAIHVIALSPGMEEGVLKYIENDKVSVIPNMSKIDEFYPRYKSLDLMSKLKLKSESFKIIYFGAMGLSNGLETILDSIKLFQNDSNFEFIFLGDGSEKIFLQTYAKKNTIENIYFFDSLPMKMTSEIVNFCDIVLVSFLDLPILYTNSPNKLFDALSAGKPIIVNSAGWTKKLVEDNLCGFYVDPNIAEDLKDKINFLYNNKKIFNQYCVNSRNLAITKFDKSLLCKDYVKIINKIEFEINFLNND